MKKRTKSLVLLLAVLVVLEAAFVIVSAVNAAMNGGLRSRTPPVSIGSAADPVALSCTADGETLRFILDGGEWRWAEGPELPLIQSYVTRIASAVRDLTAVRTLELPEDLAEYGLKDPAYELVAEDADGGSLHLLIGGTAGTIATPWWRRERGLHHRPTWQTPCRPIFIPW